MEKQELEKERQQQQQPTTEKISDEIYVISN